MNPGKEMNKELINMGFTQQEIKEALVISKQKNIDMFDALAIYQANQSGSRRVAPAGTMKYLVPLKQISRNDYKMVYSKNQKMHPTVVTQLRFENTPVGLMNVSNCCYLNSLLQCYFLMGDMVIEIMSAEKLADVDAIFTGQATKLKRIKNEYTLLEGMRNMFNEMAVSSKRYLNPLGVLENLVNCVGDKVAYGEEKDLFQIHSEIIERLTQCLKYTAKYYVKSEQHISQDSKNSSLYKSIYENCLKKMFFGKKIQSYSSGNKETKELSVQYSSIIINAKHKSLYLALDEQFTYWTQQGDIKTKHETYLQSIPQYLLMYINYSSFNKEENKVCKEQYNFTFDFTIFFDCYMQKNKDNENIINNSKLIKELLQQQSHIENSIYHLQALIKNISQCYEHAQFIEGKLNGKLPAIQVFKAQMEALTCKLSSINQQLHTVQSKDQAYHLLYIFVHRGDSHSGHYWGYGRNGSKWFRYDVNCSQIEQKNIIKDMISSGCTPYALFYVTKDKIPNFNYTIINSKHQLQFAENLLDLSDRAQPYCPYIRFMDQKKLNELIDENASLLASTNKKQEESIVQGVLKDYFNRYNLISSKVIIRQQGPNLPLYSLFPAYLKSIGENQLMKYNLYATALRIVARFSTDKLIKKEKLLQSLQKKFKKYAKDDKVLRHYIISSEPIQNKKYHRLYWQYLTEKHQLKLIEQALNLLAKENNSSSFLEFIQSCCTDSSYSHNSYIGSLLSQLIVLFLIRLAIKQTPISLKQEVLKILFRNKPHEPLLIEQLQELTTFEIPENDIGSFLSNSPLQQEKKDEHIDPNEKEKMEVDWKVEQLVQESNVINKIKDKLPLFSKQMQVYNQILKKQAITKRQCIFKKDNSLPQKKQKPGENEEQAKRKDLQIGNNEEEKEQYAEKEENEEDKMNGKGKQNLGQHINGKQGQNKEKQV